MTEPLNPSIALTDNALSRPLIEDRIAPQGIRLIATTIHAAVRSSVR